MNVPIVRNLVASSRLKTRLVPVHSHESKLLHNFEAISNIEESVDQISTAAYQGFKDWAQCSYKEKNKIFGNVIKALEANKNELTQAQLEIGVCSEFAHINISGSIEQIDHYRSLIGTMHNKVAHSQCRLGLVFKRPIGPVMSIAAWNAPVILACRAIIAPLAAGCSVILKSSEKSPRVSQLLVECFHKGGIPANVLQLIHTSPEDAPLATQFFLENDNIRKINFTGSTKTGREIAKMAAANLKPCLLELGGKNSVIVNNDADLNKAVTSILVNSWFHQGQICMSSERVYIHQDIYDKFKSMLVEKAQLMAKDFNMCQRDEVITNRTNQLVTNAIANGAEIIFGQVGKPIILGGVTSDMDVFEQELFGPVFSVHKFSDINAVVNEINASKYGLKSVIWTRDVLKALDLAKQIQTGGVHINRMSIHDEASLPHGGVKESGVGRFNGIWGYDEFSYDQTVTID